MNLKNENKHVPYKQFANEGYSIYIVQDYKGYKNEGYEQ